MRRIKQLEGALGRKTLENEIIKGAGQNQHLCGLQLDYFWRVAK
jgi:hypothetical protein